MDTKLLNRDIDTTARGLPFLIGGERELLQRAFIRLTVRKGSFPLDPSLGSELYRLRGVTCGSIYDAALAYARECLITEEYVTADSVTVTTDREQGKLRLDFKLTVSGRKGGISYEL
jgi:hypothetical protein